VFYSSQFPNLNPKESAWLIFKQRLEQRIDYPEENDEEWDGSTQHLKRLLLEIWDSITLEEIQTLIRRRLRETWS
jgi:hypothetical protein